MKYATPKQIAALAALIETKELSSQAFQKMLNSGVFPDIFDANFKSFDRDAVREALGLRVVNFAMKESSHMIPVEVDLDSTLDEQLEALRITPLDKEYPYFDDIDSVDKITLTIFNPRTPFLTPSFVKEICEQKHPKDGHFISGEKDTRFGTLSEGLAYMNYHQFGALGDRILICLGSVRSVPVIDGVIYYYPTLYREKNKAYLKTHSHLFDWSKTKKKISILLAKN